MSSQLVLEDSGGSEQSQDEEEREDRDKKSRRRRKQHHQDDDDEDEQDDEQDEQEGDSDGNYNDQFVSKQKVTQAELTPSQRSLVEKTNKVMSDIIGEYTNSAPISAVLAALCAALEKAAPHLDHLATLKTHVDREVALRTQELSQVVNLLVSTEAAVQGLKSLKAFCVQRNLLTVKCEELAAFGHPSVTVPLDFNKLKEYGLLAFVGAKGVASAQLSSLSLWLLFCNESKTRFLTVTGKLGCKMSYAQGQLLSGKKGPLHDVCKKISAKQIQGYTQDNSSITTELEFGLIESLQIVRGMNEWKMFKATQEGKATSSGGGGGAAGGPTHSIKSAFSSQQQSTSSSFSFL